MEMVFANPLDHGSLDNLSHLLGKSINQVLYRGDVLAMIEQAYGTEKKGCGFEGMEGENIEIGDGVKPEDVSEEDAPIIKYVHSVIKDASKGGRLIFIWNRWRKIPGSFSGG